MNPKRGANNVLILQAIVVVVIIIAGVWFATEWTAAHLGFQARLGRAWIIAFGLPVYPPWRLFQWWYAYEAYAPRVFNTGGMMAGGAGIAGAMAAIVGSIWRSRQASDVTTFGSARWATRLEIRLAGLFSSSGIIVGRVAEHYLRHSGPEHGLVFAPTRTGKGVGIVIPTALTWRDSAVIHDIKGENFNLTAGFRSTFSHCLYFNPTDERSARYNPLLEVRIGPNEVRDVQNIADILVDPEGALERRNHWEKTSHALLVGAILHVLYAGEDKTLSGVANFLSDPDMPFERTLQEMLKTPHLGDSSHPVVASAAREVLNKSENERSGVLSTAMSFLGLYRDPTVAKVTARCDWRIADLVEGKHPVSLYLVVPPSDISRTKPLIRLLLNQIGRRLTEKLPNAGQRQLLFMLDEFPALGRLEFFETALAFMASYGLRALLIAQSLNQIEKAYGPNHSFLDNCHLRVTFATNDERTAKRISDALGTATETRAQRNYAGHRLAPWLGHLMISRQESARALLTPGEIMQLPADEEIVLVAGHAPVRAKKLKYYQDHNFTSRILPPPALHGDGYRDRPPIRSDDWTGRPLPKAPVSPSRSAAPRHSFDEDGGLNRSLPLDWETPERSRDSEASRLDEGSHRIDTRQVLEDQELKRLARMVAMDPDDGIPL
jgi:type IV secretion system protein VirD4